MPAARPLSTKTESKLRSTFSDLNYKFYFETFWDSIYSYSKMGILDVEGQKRSMNVINLQNLLFPVLTGTSLFCSSFSAWKQVGPDGGEEITQTHVFLNKAYLITVNSK